MADQEERILITKCSGWCHALRVSCDPFDDDDGMYCDKSGKWERITEKDCAKCKAPVLSGISRQEAIERMAKSLFKVDNVLALDIKWSQLKKIKQLAYKELAEAALNSLLEVHDDER